MGSPLSPIIAEFVFDKLFLQIKDIFQDHIKFFTKYVDDSSFIMNDSIFDLVFSFISKFDSRNKFTLGKNKETINFLIRYRNQECF